ncbi:MAG: acetyl-CoA hydrolase [Coriobacteriia bacterium]|nr:acetyl-CoA hydrolase [Coriobacteriia bacterium]MCL2749820.1 acetyl-CoA hydrolase [Coriobacteriia bacterium]
MSNWKDLYNSKLTTFEDAVKCIKTGDTVLGGVGPGNVSPDMYMALFGRAAELDNITIFDAIQVRGYPYLSPDLINKLGGKFTHISGYGTPALRQGYDKKTTDFYPTGAVETDVRLRKRADVFMVMVAPPNDQGFLNLGLSSFMAPEVIEGRGRGGALKTLIGEVNENMPVVYGSDQWVHISEFDYLVENASVIPATQREAPGEKEEIIGKYVLDLIEDGATLQIGWGGVAEAVIAGLDKKKDLGIHTEMIPAGVDKLVEKGAVTNMNKPINRGISTATVCFGDQDLYEYARENPSVNLCRGSKTNSIAVISQHPKMTCINGALEVTLAGEVAAHTSGHRVISGAGGQLEFMIGAQYSEGGKGINLLHSTRTDKEGNVFSNIVPSFIEGTQVTVPATYSDYVITEYGVAQLRYLSRRERAAALIEIAHPDFREELRASMKQHFYFTG